MSTCGIYKITNTINNKCYIGQSIHIKTRWRRHKANYNNKNEYSYSSHLYRSIRKYGIENFKFEIIEECDYERLNERETYWIAYYDSYNNGYNETLGGGGKLQVDRDEFRKYFIEKNPTVKEIADYFDIDRAVAGRILKELGLKAKYYVSKEKEEQICDYYLSDTNLTVLDVSNKFNIDRDTVSRVLKRNDVEVRRITINSLNRYKKILIYDLDGNFIREDLLSNFKQWLFENNYTKDKKGRCVMGCLKGNLWQANGFIVRWYKENYPIKININDYWDKNGIYEHKQNFLKIKKSTIKQSKTKEDIFKEKKLKKSKNITILIYGSNDGLFIREASFLQEIDNLIKQGRTKKRAEDAIWSVLCGYKKSYNGYIYRYYKDNYPQEIDITKNWKNYYWAKEGGK